MNELIFYKTADNSTGLYNNLVKDIYHSKTGALKEAFEKFIYPINFKNILTNKNNINVLDICSGILYNTKALISSINGDVKANIDCIDKNKELSILAPFISDSLFNESINLKILNQLLENGITIDEIILCLKLYYTPENFSFFLPFTSYFINFIKNLPYKNNLYCQNKRFLHNIYYEYISTSMNKHSSLNEYKNLRLNFEFCDARKFIKKTDTIYDIIFLDGFSPQKDPCLWSEDFIKELSSHLNYNSIIVSYSKSTPFRAALLNSNLFVGKTFIENVDSGTIASNNPQNINFKLSDFDLNLINTRCGITYKDKNLNLPSSEIISNRKIEQNTSSRVSSTKFLKSLKK